MCINIFLVFLFFPALNASRNPNDKLRQPYSMALQAGHAKSVWVATQIATSGKFLQNSARFCQNPLKRTFMSSGPPSVDMSMWGTLKLTHHMPQIRQRRTFKSSVVTAALKNGIVGLPNVGKVRLLLHIVTSCFECSCACSA